MPNTSINEEDPNSERTTHQGSENEDAKPLHQYDAFVSHATADKREADQLVEDLERRGLKCWIAPRDIQPGGEYGAEIIRGIRSSRTMVVLLSRVSVTSRHVRAEVERAVSLNHTIYPVRLEEVELGAALEFFLSIRQSIDLFNDPARSNVERLALAISSDADLERREASYQKRPRRLHLGISATIGGLALAIAGLGIAYYWSFDPAPMQTSDTKIRESTRPPDIAIPRISTQTGTQQIDLNNLVVSVTALTQYQGGYLFSIRSDRGSMPRNLQYSINEAEFKPYKAGSRVEIGSTGMPRLLVRTDDGLGNITQTRDMTDEINRAIIKVIKQSAQQYRNQRSGWACSINGCKFREASGQKVICSPHLKKAELSQDKAGMAWQEVDRSACTDKSSVKNVCSVFPAFKLPIDHSTPFTLRLTFVDDTVHNIELPMNEDVFRFTPKPFADNLPLESWIPLKPMTDRNPPGASPLVVLAFTPADVVVGGFNIVAGIGGCGESPLDVKSDGWLIDEDGLGLVRTGPTLKFGPVHEYRLREPDRVRRLAGGKSVIGIAADLTGGDRVGPYWYEFDAREAVKMASTRAKPAQVSCRVKNSYEGTGFMCRPRSAIAWVDEGSIAFGPQADGLSKVFNLSFGVEEFMLSDCSTNPTTCLPFSFDVPAEWPDVFYQITDGQGRKGPIERVVVRRQ